MLRAYARYPSVIAGGTLSLHVAANAPVDFSVAIYRVMPAAPGSGMPYQLIEMGGFDNGWYPATVAPLGDGHWDFGWGSRDFAVPIGWPSAPYLAVLSERDQNTMVVTPGPSQSAYAEDGQAFFVVKSSQPGHGAKILYKLALNTYQAYNPTGNNSIYSQTWFGEQFTFLQQTNRVSFLRPGGGTGAVWANEPAAPPYGDPYAPDSPGNTFAHLDAPFVAWLEANGYAVDYCTDLDIHEDPGLLKQYRLMITAGHDEYWTEGMRTCAEEFVAHGGNIAFFSGNTCYRHAVYLDWDGQHYTAMRRDAQLKMSAAEWADIWHDPQLWDERNNPENHLTGVSTKWGGSGIGDVGYKIQHPEHWVYDGTGVAAGDVFGDTEHLVGEECDGAHIASLQHDPIVADGSDGTLPSFVILGYAPLPTTWWSPLPAGSQYQPTATMGVYTNRGIVFNGATIDWARVLAAGDPIVTGITRNVLGRLSLPPVHITDTLPDVCNAKLGIENTNCTFRVDLTGLSLIGTATLQWSASTGDTTTGPQLTIVLPSAGQFVTVIVEVTDGGNFEAFGTFSFRVVSQAEFDHAKLVCMISQMRALVLPWALKYADREHPHIGPIPEPDMPTEVRSALVTQLESRLRTLSKVLPEFAKDLSAQHPEARR